MNGRTRKILWIGVGSLTGLVVVTVIAALLIARTERFRQFVRVRIISAVELATGGRVELERFEFDVGRVSATMRNFVLHGTEPAGDDPLFRADRIEVDLTLLSALRGKLDISAVEVNRPRANLIVFPDGRTNVPRPKIIRDPSRPLETLVDLAIGRFLITDGLARFREQSTSFSAQGQNLRAELSFDHLARHYQGNLSLNPLYLQTEKGKRLDVAVQLPVVLGSDRIELRQATLTTPLSRLTITGSIEDLANPKANIKAQGKVDLPEIAQAARGSLTLRRDVPRVLSVDLDARLTGERMEIGKLDLALGQSRIEASGKFGSVAMRDGVMNFRADLVVAELAKLTNTPAQVSGNLAMVGRAQVRSFSDYAVDANLTGRDLAVRHGSVHVRDARLQSTIAAGPRSIRADPIRLQVAGGSFTGKANVENLERYHASGQVAGFQLQQILAAAGGGKSAWGTTISGPLSAEGEFDGKPLRLARARLDLTPNGRGIPLRGRLSAVYDAIRDSVSLEPSYLMLPASRLDLSGSINQLLTVRLTSRDLDDLSPAIALVSASSPQMPVHLEPTGLATAEASITGKLSAPVITGRVQLSGFQVQDRRFDRLTADVRAASNRAVIENARLTRGALDARVDASIGLRQWKPHPAEPLSARVSFDNADVRDLLALAGRSEIPVLGELTLSAQASGTIGNPQGSAEIRLRKGEAYGEPLESVDGKVSFGGQRVEVSSFRAVSNQARLDFRGVFEHPVEDFSSGVIRGHVQANQVALARIAAVQKRRPGLDGSAQLNGDIEATLHPPGIAPERLELTSLNGSAGLRDIRDQGQNLGNITVDIKTHGREVAFRLQSDFAGSSTQADGRTTLTPGYPTTARLDIRNLPIEKALQVAGEKRMQASGLLSAQGEVGGTLENPSGEISFDLARAAIRDQKIDRAQGRVTYKETYIDVQALDVRFGPNRLTAEGTFTHPAGDFSKGDLKLALETNSVQLAQIAEVQRWKPGLTGTVQATVKGAGHFNRAQNDRPWTLSGLTAHASARELVLNGVNYGGLAFQAEQKGDVVDAKFDSNVAQSTIHGTAQIRMAADYPITARVAFEDVHYRHWANLIGRGDMTNPSFDVVIAGKIEASGPAFDPRRLNGTGEFSKFEVHTSSRPKLDGSRRQIVIRNEGPVRITAASSTIEIRSARWTGPSTLVSLTGRVGLQPKLAFDLNVQADANLELLRDFDPNIHSEGSVVLKATIQGSPSDPAVNGRVELRNAAFARAGLPNGVSKANGTIELSGATARILSFTAETGGGDVTLTGGIARTQGVFRFDLQGRARGVRVRADGGASVTADGRFQLAGTSEDSLASGNINIRTVSFNSRTDFGSMLTRVAPPPETPSGKQNILSTMRLNFQVRMGVNTTFRTTFAENLEATADIKVRGTALNPGVLGRIVVSQGELVFFGTRYSLNEGTVSFYNPTRIEPVLNLSLATTARGVNVSVLVTGPVQNMTLSYRSDPPLQFSEIVALLAVGTVPTSDPVLLAHQPQTPQQSLPQMGASALLGAAVAKPISGQLERVFGVTQLKIDPTFTSGSELPQARLTLQQQISSDLTFTYITNLAKSDSQIVRAEWAINANWSAIATRQENGMVGVDLFYKRSFR